MTINIIPSKIQKIVSHVVAVSGSTTLRTTSEINAQPPASTTMTRRCPTERRGRLIRQAYGQASSTTAKPDAAGTPGTGGQL
jgi:hypothetical protein